MRGALGRVGADRTIVSNAVSFFGSTLATSGLGFAYTWFAARLFDKATFGLAQAGVSAMMLLGGLALLGLTTLLVGELPRERSKAWSLISAALIVAALAGGALGLVFSFFAPLLSAKLGVLVAGSQGKVLFTLGVVLTTVTQVFDYAMVALLRSNLQLWRNIISSGVKVGALLLAAQFHGPAQVIALLIYSTWTLGHLISLFVLAASLARQSAQVVQRPDWKRLGGLTPAALKHHALNISWQAPSWIFPLLVTAYLGTSYNASFYVVFMIFNIVFMVPNSFTTVLYAVNAADVSLLAQKTRFTLRTSFLLTALACLVLIPLAPYALHLFGKAYASEATGALRLLVLSVFPLIIKQHFLAVSQVRRRLGRATGLMAMGAGLEVGGALLGVIWGQGSSVGGMSGLCLGMLAGQCLEAALMGGVVYGALRGAPEYSGKLLPQASSTD